MNTPVTESPNILLIMSDQHNHRFMGCAGNSLVRTPNLDRLAAEGMRFTDAYCPAPVCVPSRMSFMTSRRPWRSHVWNNAQVLSDAMPTWAHVLGAAGYHTMLAGKMHFMGMDQLHGFQERPVADTAAAPIGAKRETNCYKYFPQSTAAATRDSLEWSGTGTTAILWKDGLVAETIEAYLREWAEGDGEQPFAVVAGLTLPHSPYIAPQDLFDCYFDRVELPEVEENQPESIVQARESRGLLEGGIDPHRLRVSLAAYYALCEACDRNVGHILDVLDELGLSENTLVIYCSDHGDNAWQHGLFWKSTMYDSSARVPLIARMPGMIEAGAQNNNIVNLIDLGPTFHELCGSQLDWDTDGRSLWGLMRGEDSQWDQETFCEIGAEEVVTRMVRFKHYKYWAVFDQGKEVERVLFDLESDPEETFNLSGAPEHKSMVDDLHERLLRDWDPETACRDSKLARRDSNVLRAWGEKVMPPAPYQFVLPDPAIESDFVKR